MKVDILHRHHLSITSSGGSALYAENGTERRLAQCDHGIFSYLPQAVSKSYGRGGLALTRRCGRNGGNKYQLSFFAGIVRKDRQVSLCLIFSVRLNKLLVYVRGGGYLTYRLHFTRLRNFNVGKVCHVVPPILSEIFYS